MSMLNRFLAGRLAPVLVACVLAGAPGAQAQEMVRPAVGKPLLAAKSFLAAGSYAKATAALRQAEAVPGKTAHETLLITQMRAAIANRSGDLVTASHAYEALIDQGAVSGTELLNLLQAEVSIAFQQKNYPAVVNWSQRYLKANPKSAEMQTALIQGYYLQGKYAEAARLQLAQVQAATHAGHAPTEVQLQLLYSCQTHLGDKDGALTTIKQLVTYYPKPDYWLNVINNLRTKPGFSDRLLLDVYRLEFSLGLVNKPDDAMDMAELLLQAKLPGDAKDVVDKSFASGLLGTGAEAARHARLRALVEKNFAASQAQLGHDDAAAASDHDGTRLLALGETYVSYGDVAKGIPMIQQAIAKDDLRHPEDAKLQLGLAYLKAGDKRRAVATLRTVGGTEGAADLAQLWILHIGRV